MAVPQMGTWPAYCLHIAPTGSGKTGVMELAIVRALVTDKAPKVLYLAPTKVESRVPVDRATSWLLTSPRFR